MLFTTGSCSRINKLRKNAREMHFPTRKLSRYFYFHVVRTFVMTKNDQYIEKEAKMS